MTLIQIANILMQEIEGTAFTVDYSDGQVYLWSHGVEPLKAFQFSSHKLLEHGNDDELKEALKFIKDNK
jgi:hypothetical protein